MVPVNNPINHCFAAQSSALRNYMAEHFRWPSPDTGFALFAFHEIEQPFPVPPAIVKLRVPRIKSSAQAPELAAAGFYAILQGENGVTPSVWAEAFARLTERDAFPLDRLAFTCRPFELSGITIGAQRTPTLSNSQRNWLIDVIREAKKKCVTDRWSLYMLASASAILGLTDSFGSLEPLENLDLDELALLVWLKASPRFRSLALWKDLDSREVQKEFLIRSINQGHVASDIGRAAVRYAAIQISVNSLLQSSIDENWQVRSVTKDAVDLIVQICRRFPKTVQQLRVRHNSRPSLEATDEYDVQDLLHSLLWLHFDDVRAEEWAPSYGGISSRMDFLLKSERVVIETKMTRASLKQKSIVKQLIEDKEHYRTHPSCEALVAFIYDPGSYCDNPVALENDLSETNENFSVRVVVSPRSV
jgi:hypothetical protein